MIHATRLNQSRAESSPIVIGARNSVVRVRSCVITVAIGLSGGCETTQTVERTFDYGEAKIAIHQFLQSCCDIGTPKTNIRQ